MKFVHIRGIFLVLVTMMAVLCAPLVVLGQAETPAVNIQSIDSQNFPVVDAVVSVTNSAGFPIANLTASDFQLTEDGAPVSAANYTLTPQEGEPLSIVLALDSSVQWPAFRQLQTAAKALVDSLGPKDQVAILIFSETVQIAQPFTGDKTKLDSVIDAQAASGLFTAFNDAALKAVNLASTAPTTNRAVILVTNSGDTSGNSSATDAVAQAVTGKLPIITVGYGSGAPPNALKSVADQTGGVSYALPDSAALAETLPTVEDGLREITYQVSYRSGIKPDNQSHNLTVSVTQAGVAGQGANTFIAVSHTVGVTVPGITDGQTVVGKVYLVAQTDSASPVASVDYLLNGQPIATVTTAPYSFEWDSTTVNPGTYQLTVRATDNAGNKGETNISVNVSIPFAVQISAATDRVQVGDDLTLDAKIDTPAQIAQTDLLVDDQVVATDTDLPFHFVLNTKPFKVGEHVVKVRAVDVLGRSAESELPVRFTEAYLPIIVRWAFAGLIVIAIVIVLVVGLGLARSTGAAQEKRLYRTIRAELVNQGNARSRYELRADDPINALNFEFSLNGSPLAQRQAVEGSSVAVSAAPTPGPLVKQVPVTATSGASASKKAGGAMAGVKGVLGIGTFLGGILGGIAPYMPAGVANSMTSLAMRLRGGEYAMSRVESNTKTVKELSTGGGYGTGKGSTPTIESPRGDAPASAQTQVVQGQTVATPTASGPVVPGLTRVWAQTPVVEPGQTLAVTLTLRPVKPRQTQQYFFRVVSQAIDAEGVAPIIEQGNLQIQGLSIMRRFLPFLVVMGMLVIVLGLIVLLLLNIGLFG